METNKEKGLAASRKGRAVALFKQGFNCAQSVFAAYADLYGLDEELALKISASFGGGMGRMREVCGCMSAMALIAGFETGSTTAHDPAGKQRNYEMVQHLAQKYKEVSGGSIICRELLGLAPAGVQAADSTPRPDARTEAYYKKRPCIHLIEDACTIIESEFFGG